VAISTREVVDWANREQRMGVFRASMEVPGVLDWPLTVHIELEQEWVSIAAAGHRTGSWPLDEVRITNSGPGFEVEARGGRFFVSTENDREFALEWGLRGVVPVVHGPASPLAAVAVEESAQLEAERVALTLIEMIRSAPHAAASEQTTRARRVGWRRGRRRRPVPSLAAANSVY
jgi:hypothetical protein